MLNQWQLFLLDNALWAVPVAAIVSMMFFPWSHWNSILEDD